MIEEANTHPEGTYEHLLREIMDCFIFFRVEVCFSEDPLDLESLVTAIVQAVWKSGGGMKLQRKVE
jgi:hypothetical protein